MGNCFNPLSKEELAASNLAPCHLNGVGEPHSTAMLWEFVRHKRILAPTNNEADSE